MKVCLTRHGRTSGNARHCYLGCATDEPLSEEGRAAARALPANEGVSLVYTSGMRRTEETASILYPNASHVVVPDLREMDFGRFEGKNHGDLKDDAEYRAWVEGGCREACPGGEAVGGFARRCVAAFRKVMAEEEAKGSPEVRFVVHGGTIMSLLGTLARPARDYFDCFCANVETWECSWEDGALTVLVEPPSVVARKERRERAEPGKGPADGPSSGYPC